MGTSRAPLLHASVWLLLSKYAAGWPSLISGRLQPKSINNAVLATRLNVRDMPSP
jgi:hypothetical protein